MYHCSNTGFIYFLTEQISGPCKNPENWLSLWNCWWPQGVKWPKRTNIISTYSTKYCRNSLDSYGSKSTTVISIRKRICDNIRHNLQKILSSFSFSFIYILKWLTSFVKLPCTSPSTNISALNLVTNCIRSSTVRFLLMAWYFWMTDHREGSRICRRTSLWQIRD